MARPPRLFAVRATPLLGAGLLVALVAAPALAGEVYKWKDAKGVTHYSDAPPAGSNYESREIRHRPGMPASGQADAKPPVENSRCTEARTMLAQLQSGDPVGIDADGDGKADGALSEAQRAAQQNVAEASISANCSTVEAPPAA